MKSKICVKAVLKSMLVGEVKEFPGEKLGSICASVSVYSFETGRLYKTRRFTNDEGNRIVRVQRIS